MTTGSVLAQFTITLSQAVSEQVAVEWYTSDGTALAGVDYAAGKGTVLFAPGETSKVVEILVYGRAVGSEDRSFFVEMLPPVNAILGASIGECIIHVDTTGSTPVSEIIVPTGPQGVPGEPGPEGPPGPKGDTPTAEDIKDSEFAAKGTSALSHPDLTTIAGTARRIAYVAEAKIATVVLADGDNLLTQSDLTGDVVDFSSAGIYPRVARGASFISPVWSLETDGRLLIKNAVAGDVLYVCQYDILSSSAISRHPYEALRRSYEEAGYHLRQQPESFKNGGTLTSGADVLLDDATWIAYSGAGPFPQTVDADTDPSSGGFVARHSEQLRTQLSSISGVELIGRANYAQIRAYVGGSTKIQCLGKVNLLDGRYGLFVRDDTDTISTDDDVMVLVDALGRRWKRQHVGPLLPRFAGVVGDGVVDDYAACAALIAVFKKRGSAAPGGTDMGGDGIDWTGYRCRLSQKLDMSGLFNYSFVNPSFIAHITFTGTALLRIDSDHTYLASGITWINPQLDAAWMADYCVEAYDFLKWTMVGGKFSHYKKKGFITGTIHDAPHEINAAGPFFFQREYNETFPPSITEAEAFEINNFDNDFTGIVVGYQKLWAFTLNKGSNKFMGGHFYTGLNSATEGGVRSYDVGNDFIGVYFDYTWVRLAARNSAQGCQFGVNDGGKAVFMSTNPFLVKVTNCRFNKTGATSNVFDMPTIAGGRVARPNIYDNEYNGCTGISTRGPWFQPIGAAVVTVQVPDEFRPLGNFSMPGRAASVSGAYADRIFGASYNAATNDMTINCYQVSSGSMVAATLGGGSMVMQMNV